ncbi:hypothetical protein IQ07DRAFT_370234 [Pyrenochaeta sp. DS3sAY3a]|nr:hypothetical protein IQ07DRAFT_370234 [Pyrenochaeta sp. DS3sAY3a]
MLRLVSRKRSFCFLPRREISTRHGPVNQVFFRFRGPLLGLLFILLPILDFFHVTSSYTTCQHQSHGEHRKPLVRKHSALVYFFTESTPPRGQSFGCSEPIRLNGCSRKCSNIPSSRRELTSTRDSCFYASAGSQCALGSSPPFFSWTTSRLSAVWLDSNRAPTARP